MFTEILKGLKNNNVLCLKKPNFNPINYEKKLKTIVKVLVVFVMLTSCATENLDLPNQDSSLVNAKIWFDTSKPNLKVLDYINALDWNNAILTNGDKGTIVEVPLTLKGNFEAKVGDEKSLKTYHRLMFIPDEKERYKAYHVLITTNEKTFDSKSKAFNFYKLNTGFNGYVTVLNSKNEITDFDKYQDLKLVSKPLSNKLAPAELTCVYYGYLDEFNEFHKISLVYCYEAPGSGGGEIFYGSGGGTGGGSGSATSDPKAVCEASLKGITDNAFSTSNLLSATISPENLNTRTAYYSWEIFNCSTYKIISYETGTHKKVINSDPNLQWEWVSLTHNNCLSSGKVVLVDISFVEGRTMPEIGKYNAIMAINYSVKFSLVCEGLSPATSEMIFLSDHNFNINDKK